MNADESEPWVRGALLGIALLVVLTPIFGWASGVVDYAEPLENAAEATGGAEAAETVLQPPLPDYSVPGLATPIGTLVSAIVGTGLTLGLALTAGRLLES